MAEAPCTVFYEKVYAGSPEEALNLVEASVRSSTINMCPTPAGKDPYTLANQLLENCDPRVAVGSVGCIDLTKSSHNKKKKEQLWLLFGWEPTNE